MSRTLSPAALGALNAQESTETFLILVTLSHPALQAPIRVTSDSVETISRGNSFQPFPFRIVLPDDSDDNTSGRARLSIDNVDRQIVFALRGIDDAATVLIEIVRAAAPDTVEASFPDFRLTNVRYDARTVDGDLTLEDFTGEPYPAAQFTPGFFPGLF